jgi:hypothetical protein
MSFADPLPSVSLNAVVQTLPRISTNGQKSVYRQDAIDATHPNLVSTISHTPSSTKVRSMFRLDQYVDVNADGKLELLGCWVALDRPLTGFTATQQKDLILALIGALTANSNAGIIKLVAQES